MGELVHTKQQGYFPANYVQEKTNQIRIQSTAASIAASNIKKNLVNAPTSSKN